MTSFFTTVPIADALWNAPKKISLVMNWKAIPGNKMQHLVLRHKETSLALAEELSPRELMSEASNQAAVVNKFLADNGFPEVRLDDNGSKDSFYAASIIKLLGKFMEQGERNYRLREINKPAFRLGRGSVMHYRYNDQTVVEIYTHSKYNLYITKPTGVTGMDMIEDWYDILGNVEQKESDESNGVILPLAKIDSVGIEVHDLVGMSSDGWVIVQALMAAKFALTPREVKFEAAFAYGTLRGYHQMNEPYAEDYVADHPLYFCIATTDEDLPLVVGLIDPQDLSDDPNLE